ncbi:hypothetical protein MBLNU457_g0194t2 [Dothideomycetes sp. NU457]
MQISFQEYWRPQGPNERRYDEIRKGNQQCRDGFLEANEKGFDTSRKATRDYLNWKLWKRVFLIFVFTLLLIYLMQPSQPSHATSRRTRPLHPALNLTTHDIFPTDWSSFAYSQYATNEAYLCNSATIFSSLRRLNTKASLLLLYPSEWDPDVPSQQDSRVSRTLRLLRDEYLVDLQPITPLFLGAQTTWADSFTKLIVFNQTQYDRLLHLDSDATVLQNLDHLFLLPPAPVALPRAYWLPDPATLSTQIMLVQPSTKEFARILSAMYTKRRDDYDMEIVNKLYANNSIILPHRDYDLLTGEFRNAPNEHAQYLGSAEEEWDARKAIEEAKYVHFSDWPHPKPWITTVNETLKSMAPNCSINGTGDEDCSDRDIWTGLYDDFRTRRAALCPEMAESQTTNAADR